MSSSLLHRVRYVRLRLNPPRNVLRYGASRRSVIRMPRPGPARPVVVVRISQAGIDKLDQIAAETGTTRSTVIREALALFTRTHDKKRT